MKSESSVDKFALSVAIGSMLILGLFLIVDANVDSFLTEFERYAGFQAFPIIAAIPAVTLAYILGAFVQVLSDLTVKLFSPNAETEEWRVLANLALADNDVLTSRYEEIRRSKKLLEGCLGPLVVLAVGIVVERNRLPHLASLLTVLALAVGGAALLTPFITSRLHRSLIRLGTIAEQKNEQASRTKSAA